jgi:hypothetical protein
MFSTRTPNGRWRLVQSLNASLRISTTLLSKAHKPARGNALENKTT